MKSVEPFPRTLPPLHQNGKKYLPKEQKEDLSLSLPLIVKGKLSYPISTIPLDYSLDPYLQAYYYSVYYEKVVHQHQGFQFNWVYVDPNLTSPAPEIVARCQSILPSLKEVVLYRGLSFSKEEKTFPFQREQYSPKRLTSWYSDPKDALNHALKGKSGVILSCRVPREKLLLNRTLTLERLTHTRTSYPSKAEYLVLPFTAPVSTFFFNEQEVAKFRLLFS